MFLRYLNPIGVKVLETFFAIVKGINLRYFVA